jgi:hypothetical protein
MATETQLQDITRTIQLAVAPVFLLTAIGTTLSVLATRLGRVIDRARYVEAALPGQSGSERALMVLELKNLERRARFVSWALTAGVVAAVLVCSLIGVAFVAYLFAVNIAGAIAVLFVAAVAVFMSSLVLFLREVFLAIAMMRFSLPPEVSGKAG